MGLYAFEIAKIKSIVPDLKRAKVLSFGHPDILATPEELEPILGRMLPKLGGMLLDRKSYSPDIVGNARQVFNDLTVVDFRQTYNVDEIFDLNEPHTDILPSFDLVIDPGTSEHCFNVGTALVNMACAVKEGGFIYHMVPLCHWNHGFWNFSPCAFHDFYTQNGFEIIELSACKKGVFIPIQVKKGEGKFEIPNSGRKLDLMCIARRTRLRVIKFPVQYKYV